MIVVSEYNKLIKYQEAFEKMLQIIENIRQGEQDETIWLLQHEDVYTVGVSGSLSDVLDEKIDAVKTNRGGKVTYHGAGQVMMYAMLDIKTRFNNDIHKYILYICDIMIKTASYFGVTAYFKEDLTGLWVKNGENEMKIASIGVRVRHNISYHGICFNVCPDLSKFDKIVPCGIKNVQMCSMKSLGFDVSVEDFAKEVERNIITLNNK